ncbi:hypothetical protein HQ865_04215 [Mucilaginibacter mali]|uniref:Uncharacterized protein n=1 Tax=Mucilaginibacter mali TaxID=2740462 RepID=A0A7D4QIA8_9SPHI|nr:hypothetical protein [Mucilaginibacter mali]QKJ28990.1 hypothetical protein HQ865_04215 [Mucilaginibacter mali]
MLALTVAAQKKLPEVQKGGLRAPDKVKIDGRLDEWGDQLQAYNKASQIFYTLTNDDTYLYLTVRAADKDAVQKINMGGITLTVSKAKKKMENAPAIIFPVYDKMGSKWFSVEDRPAITKNVERDRVQLDSFVRVKNKQLTEYFKWIGLANVKDIADNTLSIYNEEGIKIGFMLDAGVNFNCEIAIPLKYLGIGDRLSKFYYNIKLDGESRYSTNFTEVRTGMYSYVKADGKSYIIGSDPAQGYKLFPTDFWGEYNLVKK